MSGASASIPHGFSPHRIDTDAVAARRLADLTTELADLDPI
ncbi:hypothetical protein [Nocardia sp. CC227C]|nr:hypothetical protein [Nocardia sp. CC227C]